MSIITAFPGIKRSVVYRFCFLPFLDLFFYEIDHHIFRHVEFVSIWGPCLVFRLHSNDTGVSGLLFSDFLWFFFHPTDWPTQNQETYSTLNERKGDDLSLTVSFWASSTHCVCVFLYTYLLLCFVLFLSVKKNETVPRPFEDSRARVRKWKTQWFIDRKGQKEKWQWTGYSRLDIEHLLWWDLSPLPVHGVDSRCWWQFRDAVYVTGTCFTRTFPQLRSPLPPCQPCEKWCTSK